MTISENRQIIDQWCARVWGDQDQAAIYEFFEPAGMATGLGRENLSGPDEFVPFHDAMCGLLSDTWLRVDHAMEDGSEMSVLATFGGTCRKSGKKVEIDGSMTFEVSGGKIRKGINHFEFMELFEQLGLLPEDSFAKLLQGERLVAG